ncbi:MAG: DUF805 domain-containing protein [Patescibacteria group bacterium]|nr:DUF805 domain-containing protein [Patescibacteria group bacterium]
MLKPLFTSRLNARHFYFAYLLGWGVFLVLGFFNALIYMNSPTALVIYTLPALFWIYTSVVSFRRLCDTGLNWIVGAIIALAVNFPLYWDDLWYLLIPLALLIVLTVINGSKGRNRYGDPDSGGFMASVFRIQLSERAADATVKYATLSMCLVIACLGVLIYATRDQFDFNLSCMFGCNIVADSPTSTGDATSTDNATPLDPYLRLLGEGTNSLNDGDTDGAEKLYNEAITMNPERPEAYAVKSLLATGTDAMNLLHKSIAKGETAYAYALMASNDVDAEKYKEAVADATKSIELDSTAYEPYKYRAYAYISLNQYQNALDDIQQAITYEPAPDIQLLMLEGLAYNGLGMCNEAYADFHAAVEWSKGNDQEINNTFNIFMHSDASHCIDEASSTEETPTSTPAGGNRMTGVGV